VSPRRYFRAPRHRPLVAAGAPVRDRLPPAAHPADDPAGPRLIWPRAGRRGYLEPGRQRPRRRALAGIDSQWLIAANNTPAGFSKVVLVSTLLATLAVDGVINPTVEELYFRGYLLPRLPVADWRAIPVSAALFALQHYWQPWNWLLIFGLELILTTLVVRLRCVRLGIVRHTLGNSLPLLVTLVGVLR
jgi:membrane protease YdiL (CAAX protease family)